jgi:UDP-glucose-4-epimerase GalE
VRNVLVTGGAGYIGSHTSKALAGSGFRPIAYDDLSNGHRDAVRWGPLEVGDIMDPGRLSEVLQRWEPVAVIHFAGLIEAGVSVVDPLRFYRTNVEGSRQLLASMAEHEVRHIVFSSSAAVYGEPERTPIAEGHSLLPINPYGRTKLFVERMLADQAGASDLSYVALRYFNAAGADPDGEIGEAHEPESHALPLAIQSGLGLRPPFQIFGDDYPTPDGTAVRDFVHVSDLAAAHVLALARLLDGAAGSESFNVGTGIGVSVRELIDAVCRSLGAELPFGTSGRRPGDPAVLVAAPDRIKTVLGWQPNFEAFQDIVDTAVAWHRSQVAADA